jgi:hypothetical protein
VGDEGTGLDGVSVAMERESGEAAQMRWVALWLMETARRLSGYHLAYIRIHIIEVKLNSALVVSSIEAPRYLFRMIEFMCAKHSQHYIFVSHPVL